MIARILSFAHDAFDSRRLARTVLLQARQLDHLHLLAASEECRADRAEEQLATAHDRIAELELQIADWRDASGELAAELAAADVPDLEDARDPPTALPDPWTAADVQRGRADSLEKQLEAANRRAEHEHARADAQHARADDAELEAAAAARSAGAHLRTIVELRERLADALRAVHQRAPEPELCRCGHRADAHCCAVVAGSLCACEQYRPRALQIPGVRAADAGCRAFAVDHEDAAPETQPSERGPR